MWATSNRFRAAVARDHTAVIQVEVWAFGAAAPLATLAAAGDSLVLTGSVSTVMRRSIRRTCTLSIIDRDGLYTPDDYYDLLAPFGRELRIWRGVRFDDGDDELVPLGVFRISTPSITDTGAGTTIDLDGKDRAGRVQANRFKKPFVVRSEWTVEQTVRRILRNRLPGCPIGWSVGDVPAGLDKPVQRTLLEHGGSSDPWRDATRIAAADGLNLFFDAEGVAQLVPVPDLAKAAAVVEHTPGPESVIVAIDRRIDTENTISGVIVTGEGASQILGQAGPIRAEVWDIDPTSPTYIGNFGEVPAFFHSPMIVTQRQARRVAKARFRKRVAASDEITWLQIPNPAVDVWDVAQVTWPAIGIDRALVIDSVETPLDPTAAQAVAARTAVAVTDEAVT